MKAKIVILLAAVLIIALPFLLRRHETAAPADALDLVIVTPHNEAIRHEFGRAFSKWHAANYGQPVRVDWRAIGGTTEISRYLVSEFLNASRPWWKKLGNDWPATANDSLLDGKFATTNSDSMSQLWKKFRDTDDAKQFSSRVDLFFGGGEYDHSRMAAQGLTVVPWPKGSEPTNLFYAADGTPLIPEKISGETWRTPIMQGNAIATFGICYNTDRLRELGLTNAPTSWEELAQPIYFRQLGVADPTKSASIAAVFELIVQQKCLAAVHAAGFNDAQISAFEKSPTNAPAEYQQAIERGWADGLSLVQRIGANARYFTDSSSKIPVDVGMGNCAAGLCVDFYGRYESQYANASTTNERMGFVIPATGSRVSADPVSLLRGAEHRELAVRFIEFTLSEDGQKIWCYKPGTPGGPEKYALRRIPIRRDFYPSDNPALNARHLEHLKYAADNLADPNINPYAIASRFEYHARWTGKHFGVMRDIVRAMCIDSSDELQKAWPAAALNPEHLAALAKLPTLPEPLTWSSSLTLQKKHDRMDLMLAWTEFYRANYRTLAPRPRRRKLPKTGTLRRPNFQPLESEISNPPSQIPVTGTLHDENFQPLDFVSSVCLLGLLP